MKRHGNSNENDAEHHLYEIFDQEREDIYKYGICGEPLNKDGTSPRGNIQTKEFNRAFGWIRFLARVILKGIRGRLNAKRIEQEHIDAYEKEHGRKPWGNE